MSEWRLYRAAVPAQTVRFNKQKDSKKSGGCGLGCRVWGRCSSQSLSTPPHVAFFGGAARGCRILPSSQLAPICFLLIL